MKRNLPRLLKNEGMNVPHAVHVICRCMRQGAHAERRTHFTGSCAPPLPLPFSAGEDAPPSPSPATAPLPLPLAAAPPPGVTESEALPPPGEAAAAESAAAAAEAVARSSLTSFPMATGAGACCRADADAEGGVFGEGVVGGDCAGVVGLRRETMATMPNSLAIGSLTPESVWERKERSQGTQRERDRATCTEKTGRDIIQAHETLVLCYGLSPTESV